MTLKTGSQSII